MKEKKCKKCGKPRGHSLMNSLCLDCIKEKNNSKQKKIYIFKRTPIKRKMYTIKRTPIKQKAYKIKQNSSTNKNISAKFDTKTKNKIIKRDKKCINCGNKGVDCHHVYFGLEAEYGEERNEVSKGVFLCRKCHELGHSCKKGEGVRQEYIEYLLKIYGK